MWLLGAGGQIYESDKAKEWWWQQESDTEVNKRQWWWQQWYWPSLRGRCLCPQVNVDDDHYDHDDHKDHDDDHGDDHDDDHDDDKRVTFSAWALSLSPSCRPTLSAIVRPSARSCSSWWWWWWWWLWWWLWWWWRWWWSGWWCYHLGLSWVDPIIVSTSTAIATSTFVQWESW